MSVVAELIGHERDHATTTGPTNTGANTNISASTGTKVLLVDPDPISRHVLTEILRREGLEVVAADRDDIDVLRPMAPGAGIVIMSLSPDEGIPASVREMAVHLDMRVLLIASRWSRRCLDYAFAAGAAGCLVKEPSMSNLPGAVQAVRAGLAVMSPAIHKRLAVKERALRRSARAAGSGEIPVNRLLEMLTEREWQVLHLLAEGWSNAEVATQLLISPTTVKSHVSNALSKLGVRNRIQAVLLVRSAMDDGAGLALA